MFRGAGVQADDRPFTGWASRPAAPSELLDDGRTPAPQPERATCRRTGEARARPGPGRRRGGGAGRGAVAWAALGSHACADFGCGRRAASSLACRGGVRLAARPCICPASRGEAGGGEAGGGICHSGHRCSCRGTFGLRHAGAGSRGGAGSAACISTAHHGSRGAQTFAGNCGNPGASVGPCTFACRSGFPCPGGVACPDSCSCPGAAVRPGTASWPCASSAAGL